jgi:hypothetical protein
MAYARDAALTRAATAGLLTAANRFAAAKQARSNAAMLLQDGVGNAYAGELANALTKLRAGGTALAAALKRAGHTVAITSAQLGAARVYVQHGLPSRLLRLLSANGVSPGAFLQALAGALAGAPSSITFARLLGTTEAPGPYKASNHTITTAQIGAIIDALASQHTISASTHGKLTTDLHAVAAANRAKRARALAKLQSDIASKLHGTAGTLLHFAVVGLT